MRLIRHFLLSFLFLEGFAFLSMYMLRDFKDLLYPIELE